MSHTNTPKHGYDKLSGKLCWILDSGASNNMAGELNLMKNSKRIQPVPINFPNGVLTIATQQGSVV